MHSSIFTRKSVLDINSEYKRLKSLLFENWAIVDRGQYFSFFAYINTYVFNKWDYRDTFTEVEDYLFAIGVDLEFDTIEFDSMLNFVEFVMNMWNLMLKVRKYNFDFASKKIKENIPRNCKLIIDKMGYTYKKSKGNVILLKKDVDVDSVLCSVNDEFDDLILSYYDKRNNNVSNKATILKKLDIFLEENKKKLKEYNSETYENVQVIMNNYGINHKINSEKIKKLGDSELIEWYDQCFKMILHLFRTKEIKTFKDPRILL